MSVRELIRSVIVERFPNPSSLRGSALKALRELYREIEDDPNYALSQEELQDPSVLFEKVLSSKHLYNKTERCLAKISPPITGNPLHLIEFKFPLFDYQEEAVQFMRDRENEKIHGIDGGILNMAMGLGKTYTVLARIMETRHESPLPTLVVVGASLMTTWTVEAMDKFFPSLKYYIFHPNYNPDTDIFPRNDLLYYDVILTTYDFILNTYGKSYKNPDPLKQTIWERNSEKGARFPTGIKKKKITPSLDDGTTSLEEDKSKMGFSSSRSRDDESSPIAFSPSYRAEFGFPEDEDEGKDTGKIIKNRIPVRKYGKKEYNRQFNLPIREKDILSVKGGEIIFFTLWPRMVCDESQRFRSPSSTTFAALMSVPSVHCWCMTGTPMVNTSDDLFTQMRFIGYTGATTFSDWKAWNSFEKDKLIEAVFVKDASFLNLPPKDEFYDPCFFSKEEDEYYAAYLAEFLRAIKTFRTTRLKSAQGEILAMITRLRQMCVCPYMVLESKKNKKGMLILNAELEKDYSGSLGFGCAKFRKVKEILQTVPKGEKVLIFSFFKEFMPLLQLFLDKEKLGKSVMINGYRDPQERAKDAELFKTSKIINIALISYITGSEGLNLMAANHVILMEPYWNDAKMRQAIARSYRKGQTRQVTVHRLFIERGIDSVIINLCRRKNRDITETIEDAGIEEGEIAKDDEHGQRINIGRIEEIAAGLIKIEVLRRVKVNPALPTSSEEESVKRSGEREPESYEQLRYDKQQVEERIRKMFSERFSTERSVTPKSAGRSATPRTPSECSSSAEEERSATPKGKK